MNDWTVLMMGDHLGFIQQDLTWGDSKPDKAKRFQSLAEAIQAATDIQGHRPDICQIRLIRADFQTQ